MAKRTTGTTPFREIADRPLPIVRHAEGETFHRIHNSKRTPLWFGPGPAQKPGGRFDAPRRQYRILYAGLSLEAAFAETLLRTPANRILSITDLEARTISSGRFTRPLRLVRLHGAGLKRLGVAADTILGPYPICRALALALWSHSDEPDGIAYRSRFDNDEICIALFDRARDGVEIVESAEMMSDWNRIGGLLDRYGVGLDV